jgi:uncharacterized membrane protein
VAVRLLAAIGLKATVAHAELPVHNNTPIFSTPVRWILGVLSWGAFGVASYLAWNFVNNSPVAGCIVGSQTGCDAVLTSSWSKWLGIPVAVLGLNCYALLAGLSVMLIVQPNANRWITTAFILLATVVGGASAWFIAVQVFAIGHFCIYCLITDVCGLAIGAITGWCVYRWWMGTPRVRSSGGSPATLSALRSAIPANARPAPVAATRVAPSSGAPSATPTAARAPATASSRAVPLVGSVTASSPLRGFASTPPMPIAYGGALALLVLLVGGQIVFPSKTHKVTQGDLKDTINLSAQNGNGGAAPSENADTHVAMRIDTESPTDMTDQQADDTARTTTGEVAESNGANESDQSEAAATQPSPGPKRERIIKLLGGKLTVDVADEPLIGSIDAPNIVVEMLSYNCSHCRKTNSYVKRALSRYGDQVALVVLVLPLDSKCNRLVTNAAASHSGACTTARTAVALSKLKPGSFRPFHEFLMSGKDKEPPPMPSVIKKAFSLVDRNKLQVVRDSEEVQKKVASYVDLYEALRRHGGKSEKEFGLPIQILGDYIMSGSVEKADDVFKAWEEHLGVKP